MYGIYSDGRLEIGTTNAISNRIDVCVRDDPLSNYCGVEGQDLSMRVDASTSIDIVREGR